MTLHQNVVYRAHGRSRRSYSTVLARNFGLSVEPGNSMDVQLDLPLEGAVSPTIANCAIIDVHYSVSTSLSTSGWCDTVCIEMPVTIGTIGPRNILPAVAPLAAPMVAVAPSPGNSHRSRFRHSHPAAPIHNLPQAPLPQFPVAYAPPGN